MRNFLLPKVINSIYPKMKYEEYQSLKNDAMFTTKTASVCETCFLNLTRYCDFAKSNKENVLRVLRPKEINAESKFMKIPASIVNSQNTFYNKKITSKKISDNHGNKKLLMKHMIENLNILPVENKSHNKQNSHNTFYPLINNSNSNKYDKLLSVERRPFENQYKDPEKTDIDAQSYRTSIHSSVNKCRK
jgi:hypothetical protein